MSTAYEVRRFNFHSRNFIDFNSTSIFSSNCTSRSIKRFFDDDDDAEAATAHKKYLVLLPIT